MAINFTKFTKGLRLVPTANIADGSLELGDIYVDSSNGNRLKMNAAGTQDFVVGRATTDTLTNKTISGNTATNLVNGSGTFNFNSTGALTAPNATDTLVARATTDTLTNKTLSGNTATNLINGSGVFNFNSTGTLTAPNATDTLVGRTTTDTLTNKTLTAPVIATIVNTGTLTLPSSTDTLVGRATTDTLTNKTLDAALVSTYEDFTEVSSPSAPAATTLRLYAKSDGFFYYKNPSNVENQLSVGGTVTLQSAYDNDPNGSDALITTNATDGSVVIAGDQSLKITATGGIDMATTQKIVNLAAGSAAADAVNYGQVILRSGANAFSANQPMGGFKLTGLSAGTTAGDSVRYEQAILISGANAFAANQPMGGFKLTGLAAGSGAGDSVRYEQAILINGVNAFTANQPMGTHKLTGLSAGTTAGDSVRYEQAILADGTNPFTANQSMGSFNLTNVADPASAQDAATKAYVDNLLNGIKWKNNVRAASVANLNLASMPAAVDGVTLSSGDRFLAKDQTTGSQNGIYVFNGAGSAATRSLDADSALELQSAAVFVAEGATWNDIAFTQTADSITLGTTALVWVAFSSNYLTGHDMISLVGGQISVDLASSSGLESTNPANAAGQLRIKLEASNPSLKFTGSNELAAKLDAAGAITSGASGLIVGTDNSTTVIASDQVQVKWSAFGQNFIPAAHQTQDLGSITKNWGDVFITNLKSNASNMSIIDATNNGTISLYTGTVANPGKLMRGVQGAGTVDEQYLDANTLADATAATTVFSFDWSAYLGNEITYLIKHGNAAADVRLGTLRIVVDNTGTPTVTSISDNFAETADVGVSWTAVISGSVVNIKYATTSTGFARTIRADIKGLRA